MKSMPSPPSIVGTSDRTSLVTSAKEKRMLRVNLDYNFLTDQLRSDLSLMKLDWQESLGAPLQ